MWSQAEMGNCQVPVISALVVDVTVKRSLQGADEDASRMMHLLRDRASTELGSSCDG